MDRAEAISHFRAELGEEPPKGTKAWHQYRGRLAIKVRWALMTEEEKTAHLQRLQNGRKNYWDKLQ